ncbi:IQ domain-containing protein N [Leptonychotes weddellii]|uniref:IQ domain-containing protein N n=1 Tax=Leptonychotes weddellii TaxID=9713 RepID=A0A7F8PVI7_LEPWE|nr:IQ domain-containing protein N [Leptonychotes weddellii]
MQEATQLQLSPDGQSLYQPQSVSNLQDKAGTLSPQPQHKPLASRETLLQRHDKDKMVPRHIPRLRAVVESQAFKNVLVDEMDMMLSRAATLIQANWRGYRLRQKLISQMMAAKAIQEAWRRFNTRRLLRSGKLVEKKVSMEEGDIPYHAPQQVRFQHPEESKPPVALPVMVSKETQFPSSDTLAACTHQLAFLQAQLAPPCTAGDPGITFLPHQTVAMRLPCPASLDAKCHPCLLTRTVRNPCLVHVEGDTVKTKQVITRASKAGAPGPLPCGRCAQAVHGSLKTQAQTHVETEVLKAPLQTGPAFAIKTPPQMYPVAAMPKTPPQPCLVPTVTLAKTPPQVYPVARMTRTLTQMYPAAAMTKTPPQTYPAVAITKTPLQSCLAAMMNKTPPQPCSAPTVTITKAPPQTYQVAPMARSPPQTCPVATMTKTSPQTSQPAAMTKTPLQSCLAALVNKTPPQPCPAAPMSKTPTQMRPTASMTNTSPQTRPAAIMAKISPQICLLASMIKPQTQTRPVATMTKAPPQTCPVPAMTKTPTQMRPVAPMTKTPLQTCPAAAMAKTPSQTLPGASVTKTPPQTRLAAMVTKTPAQFRSMAAILRTLCLPPSAGGNLKSSPPVAVAAGIPNASSHTCLNEPKAKAVVNTKQTAGMVRVSSHSYLAEGKIKYFNSPHLGAGAPKAPAKPPLEAEKMKVFSQKEVKTETVSSTSVAIEMPRASPWVKMAEDRNKSSLQTHLRADVKVQSQVYAPVETAMVLPRAQLATCPAKAMPQTHLDTCLAKALPQERLATCSTTASSQGQLLAELTAVLPQAHLGTCLSKTLPQAHPHARLTTTQAQTHLGTCLSKALSQAHPPAKLTKAPSFAHLGTCLTKAQSQAHLATGVIKVQSQAHLPIGLTKVQSQAQLVPETAKCLHTAHQAAELSGKTQSQPLLAGFKASTQPCQHVGALGTPPRAKPEDRLTQIQPHSYVQGKATPGPRQGASETRSMLVPLLASAGHPTCNIESWGDSGATRAQSPMPSPATPCPEELTASQLASLGIELAAELGSQEDLRALLVKALSQGQVKAALNQALSKRVLGSTMAKALPQGMLGTALMKVLSWGELGLALSRTLSPGELRAELTKAKQGKLADVLSKALTEEEWAALSQALCQGELGAVLSQSLSQAALRTGVVLPKAASKTAGNRMTVIPAPVEVDHRGIPSTAWGPALGPVRPQPSKVRVPQDGAWEGFSTGWPARFLEEMGDGAMLGGSPCLPVVSMGASLASRVITAIHQYPLIAALDPSLSWEMESSRGSSSDLYLSPEVSEENVYLPPGASELASDLNPVESDTDPSLPKPPHLQLPPSLWQPLIANGVGPSTSQQSVVAGGRAPSSHKPHAVSRVAPRLWASSGEGRVASGMLPLTAGAGRALHSHQCAAAYGGSVCCCQPSGVNKVPSSSLAKPSITKLSMRSGVTPSLAKPFVTSAIAPSLAKPCMTDGAAPVIAQPSVACVVAPSLVQPSVACVVVSNLAQPPVTGGVAPSLARSFVANRGPLSLFQPSVIGGTSCAAGQSGWVPTVGSNLPPRVNAVAPSLHHPSFVTEVPWSTSYSSAVSSPGQDLSRSPVAAGMAPCRDSVMVGGVASNAQAPEFSEVSLAFHQPLGVGGGRPSITEHSEVTLSAPKLYQASGVSGEDSCLDQGTSVCAGALFRGAVAAGMFPNTSRGTLAAGMFLSMSPGPASPGMTGSVCQRSVTTGLGPNQFQMASGVTPIASPAPVAGAPLIHKQASEGPGFSRASVPNRLGTRPFRFSQANAGASMPQVNVDLPVSLNHQHPSVSTITAPGYEQANAFSQESVMDTTSGLVPGSVPSRMTTALARGTVASGVAPSLPPGSVIRGVGQSLSPGSVISAVPPHLPPGYVVGGVAQTLPEGSVICGISHSLPPGSVISGTGQGLPPDPMASAVAQNLPPGSVASGVPPSLMATSGAGGKRQSFIRPSVSFTSPSLIPGSVSSGMGPGVSPGSVASSVVPAIDPGGLNQGLILGSTDNAAGLPSAVGNVAQSLPQGSMLIGISPRPYHGALPGEGSTAPFQASHATGLAQLQPQALESSGTTRRVLQVPTVLQRASQLSHALEMMPFEATDDQAMMKPEDLNKAVSPVFASSAESTVLDATPWMSHNPLSTDHSHEFLPDGQRPLLEMVPSQTKSLASGMTPVPPQSLNFAKHCMAGGTTRTLQQRSAASWEAPSSHFVTASRVPSVHMEPVKVTGAPLTRQASVARVVPQSPLVTHRVPQGHAHKMGASPMVSGSPQLVHSSTMASSVYPGSIAGVGTPSTSQRPGTTHKTSHALYPPMAGGIASGGFQVEAVPRAHKKPESGDLTRSNHKFLGSRKSYRFMHGCLVSDMLDGNVARVVSLPEVQEPASRSSQESPEHPKSAPPAVIPISHATEVAHSTTAPQLPLGFRRVSLGYESPPDGSRRPLFAPESMQGSRDFHSTVAPAGSHRASLTPTVLQGPVDASIAGGQARNSAVPSVAVGPVSSAGAPGGAWDLARAAVPWDTAGREAAEDPRPSGELVTSLQAVEKIITRAVVTIQACARGYLVRRSIKVWHQWAVIIQAAWRGSRVRRNLARLSQAATTIQATWRGFCTRRKQTQAALLPGAWTKSASDHRCFQSCQPHVCPLCQALSPRLGSPPSVVMLVGSSPRTCHTCGHTLPTRVVHGVGRGSRVQAGVPWACGTPMASRSPRQSRRQHEAATAIQSAWRGFTVRRRLRQQQMAARMLHATRRGHHTRASLTADALLGPAGWDNSQHVQWPGV